MPKDLKKISVFIDTNILQSFIKHNRKEVSGSTMKSVPAVIPDRETLQKFDNLCAPIFAQQRTLEKQNQSLAALRDSLLPKLMSGEIDVSNIHF